jgi:NADH:ubiquinone reductase (H+-translocating)
MIATKRILVVGAGFAGMWSALGAARLIDKEARSADDIEIALVAPEAALHVRPRLHEQSPSKMKATLLPLFEATGVKFIEGHVERIHTDDHAVDATGPDGKRFTLTYDKLVLASGSRLFRPNVTGLSKHAFSIDQIEEADLLEKHFAKLSAEPETKARNTVVVVGGGFTGLEIATELEHRVRTFVGGTLPIEVVIIEQADTVGPDLGPGPRPIIQDAIRKLGIVCKLNTTVVSIDATGLVTSTGERIEASTVIWTAGMRANALTNQIGGERDRFGRLHTTDDLRVPGTSDFFAAGDVAFAATDDEGNHALMSCQHAMSMGRIAGHNAAAELIDKPLLPYRQPVYVTCLDLGSYGAVLTEGWDRKIKMVGSEAKTLKRTICEDWIYPPAADREVAFAAADPTVSVVA